MWTRILALVGALLLIGGSVAAALLVTGAERHVVTPVIPGTPYIDVISPRNGAKPRSKAVVVKVQVHNFTLAPSQFGRTPQLGEGMIRFLLNRVPQTATAKELQRASGPLGNGRVIGRSFDFPRYSGPNALLALRLGSSGSLATLPQIYYHNLPTGLYRLIIALAENDGSQTPYHTVTHFRIE